MNYQDYLKTDHWKAKRAEALEFYGYSCVLCGGQPDEVHHRHYETLWREDCAKDLVVLCDKCHEKIHKDDFEFIDDQPEGEYIEAVFLALTWSWQR